MNTSTHNRRKILTGVLSGMLLQVIVTDCVLASENNNAYIEGSFQYRTSYQMDSSSFSVEEGHSSSIWGWVAIGGATFLLLQSLSSDDDDSSSDGVPSGGGSPAGNLGVGAATFKQSNSSSSTKGRLFEVAPQHGLFFSVGSSELDLKGGLGTAGSSSERKFTLGYDRRFDSRTVAGALFDRSRTEVELNNLSTTQDESRLSVFVFLSYQFSPSSSVYSYAGLDRLEKETNRFTRENSPSAFGNADGSGYSFGLSLSHDFANYNGLLPTVLAELDYSTSTFKSYSEYGSPVDLLNYPKQSNDSLTVSLGGGLSTAISLQSGVLVPGFNVKLINELKSESEELEVTSVFGNTSGSITTSESDDLHLQFSGSASLVLRNGVQIFANYDRVFLHKIFDRNRFSIGARMEF